MKSGASSLNPYAASYVPLSRRSAAGENKDYAFITKDRNKRNETVWLGPQFDITTWNQHQDKASQNHIAQGALAHEDYTRMGKSGHGSYSSSFPSPKEMTEKQILDEKFDMDLTFLQMTFPGISDESLSDVYLANNGDLDTSIDMLNQLELDTGESSENLPDTLDIGDLSEPGTSSGCASLKLKKVAGEAAGSSGSSELARVT